MSELRAGGLAIVLPCLSGECEIPSEWAGTCVKLIRFVKAGEGIFDCPEVNEGRPFKHSNFSVWVVENGSLRGTVTAKYLMPIDGEDFSHEDERQKELTNG